MVSLALQALPDLQASRLGVLRAGLEHPATVV